MERHNPPQRLESFHGDELETGILGKMGIKKKHGIWIRKFVAEFTCSIFFTFVAGASWTTHNDLNSATAQGLAIALLVISFGHISGAHTNPMVTLGVLIAGGISFLGALLYWLAQILGCILGGFLIWCAMAMELYLPMNGGGTWLVYRHGALFQAYLMEFFITTILVYTVLMTIQHQKDQTIAGLAIGFAIWIGVLVGAPVTGGSMNPFRSLGPLVTYSGAYRNPDNYKECNVEINRCLSPSGMWSIYWVYVVGPLTGALIASIFYRIIFGDVPSYKALLSKEKSVSRDRLSEHGPSGGSASGYGAL